MSQPRGSEIVRHDRCEVSSGSRPGEDASPVGSLKELGSGHLGPPLEFGAVRPHRMQHRRELAGDGDLRLLQSGTLHDPEAPLA